MPGLTDHGWISAKVPPERGGKSDRDGRQRKGGQQMDVGGLIERLLAYKVKTDDAEWSPSICTEAVNAIYKLLDENFELRYPVTKEQVQKACAGVWLLDGKGKIRCSRCGETFEVHSAYERENYRFCPYCMAAMTDLALDEMKRSMNRVMRIPKKEVPYE